MKKFRIVHLLAGCLVVLLCAGCATTTTVEASSATTKQSITAADSSYSAVASELYDMCYRQPETLASTVSAFPSALRAVGIDDTSAINLDDSMDLEGGGKRQAALLDALKSVLEDPETQYSFVLWSGKCQMLHMGVRDENAPVAPDNLYLLWRETDLQDAKILIIDTSNSDGGKDIGLFFLEGGFLRFTPIVDDLNQSLVTA